MRTVKPSADRRDLSIKNFDALPAQAVVRAPVAIAVLGISLSTLWRLSSSGQLPAVRISPRTTGWRVGDIRALIDSRLAA